MRNAYLIIAHNKFDQLKMLIEMIDGKDNDIYLHIDKKSSGFNYSKCIENIKHSKVKQIQSIKVNWGGYSSIEAELNLIEEAIKGKYDYYHLLSGQDLLIKNQNEINLFLEQNYGKEFVHFATDNEKERCKIRDRAQYFHFFQDTDIGNNELARYVIKFINKFFILCQKAFKVSRCKNIELQFGSSWFSITDNFARYILCNKDFIKKTFKYTRCADELFIQTLLYKSSYYHNLYDFERNMKFDGCLRFVEFDEYTNKANPRVLTSSDKERLLNSACLFARKFDSSIDNEIIKFFYKRVRENSKFQV